MEAGTWKWLKTQDTIVYLC